MDVQDLDEGAGLGWSMMREFLDQKNLGLLS